MTGGVTTIISVADAAAFSRVCRVAEIVAGLPAGKIKHDAAFRDDIADDLERFALLVGLDEEFSINISDDDFERCRTFGDLAGLAVRLETARQAIAAEQAHAGNLVAFPEQRR